VCNEKFMEIRLTTCHAIDRKIAIGFVILSNRVFMPTAHSSADGTVIHHDLYILRNRLQDIYVSTASFDPMTPKPPILDASVEINLDEENQWGQENIPGMKILREAIKGDLERLESVSPLVLTDIETSYVLIFSWPVVSD